MSLLYGYDDIIKKWVSDNLPEFGEQNFDDEATAIGVLSDNGDLIAGVVYSDYQPQFGTIQLSIASINKMWARKDNIKGLLSYPFYQLNCYKLLTMTSIKNIIALKTIQHIGFKREAVLAHQLGKKHHAVISRLLKPDFIKLYEEEKWEKNRQQPQQLQTL